MIRLWTPGLGRYLLRHPDHGLTLARAGWRLRREGWYRRVPFLPLPDERYWHFRMVTVNGTSGPPLSPTSMYDAARWAITQPVGRTS
jgi:hypothetical protein